MRMIKKTTTTNDVKRQIYGAPSPPSQNINSLWALDTKGIGS